jgi:hypothetical protein
LETTTYNHSKPIVNIFSAIEAPETATQLINIGHIIITQSTIFASNIKKWQDKPEANQTLRAFKDHFKTAQKVIKKVN